MRELQRWVTGAIGGAIAAFAMMPATAHAQQTYVFNTSVGTQPANVGTITLTQLSTTSVNVFVDLLAGYGFLNTGGPHTPFAFTLAGTEAGVSANFLLPVGGTYPNGAFSLITADGENTPFGTYGVSIESSANNGSGSAYFGDLSFNVIRTSGLTTNDFTTNALGYYFSADLTDGTNTGSQAWTIRTIGGGGGGTVIPEPSTYVLLASGLLGLAGVARRKKLQG